MPQPSAPSRLRQSALALAIAAVAGVCAVSSVQAQVARSEIHMPAQELGAALDSLASQTGARLLYSPQAVKGLRAPALDGRLGIEEALSRLLAGSGLGWSASGVAYAVKPVGTAPESRATELAPVTVTATRSERSVEDVPASVSVIGRRELDRQQFVKIQDALKHVEGIDFNEQPASGGAAEPQIRGIGGSFAGSTSVTLVDSMPTDSFISGVLGRGGLNFLAAQDIDRIEVLRGPASALYGPNVVGGVVNVLPKRWTGAPGAEVHADAGSHGSRTLGAAVGTASDAFDVRLSVAEFRTDGFVAQPDPDPAGDRDLGPRDWKDTKWNLLGTLYPSPDQEVTVGYQQYRTDTAILGGRPNYRQNHDGDAYTLGYRKEFADQSALKLSYRHNHLLQQVLFDDQAWNGTMDSFVHAANFFRRSITDSLEGQATLRLSDHNTLIAGGSYQTASFESGWDDLLFGGNSRSSSSARSTGLFVQDEHCLGDLTLTAGGRYDRLSQGASKMNGAALNNGTVDNTFNPRLGLRYRLTPATSFYASAGTAFVPASADLKYPGNPVNWRDNPALRPETSTTYEVGLNRKLGWASLRAAVYHTDYKDKISAISVTAGFWPRQYVNIGKVAVDGLELGIEGRPFAGWTPYANYAYTDSVIKENPTDPLTVGRQTQRIAPHKLNLGATYAPGDEWSLSLAGRYVGERYFTDRNTPDHRASGYFVGDARIAARLPGSGGMGRWEAYLAINNVFDEKYTVWEYEHADRRNVWVGLNGRF